MQVESSVTGRRIIEQLEKTSDYRAKRQEIARFNAQSTILKKGLALTPVKFGVSFTQTHLNQAGALIHLYPDGSVHLAHGGTEMGQGLFQKVAQIVADELGVPLAAIHHAATRTDKVPNASPTAASASSDLNGMAARNAAHGLSGAHPIVGHRLLQNPETGLGSHTQKRTALLLFRLGGRVFRSRG